MMGDWRKKPPFPHYGVESRLFSGLKSRPKTSQAVPRGVCGGSKHILIGIKETERGGARSGDRTRWNTVVWVQDSQKGAGGWLGRKKNRERGGSCKSNN